MAKRRRSKRREQPVAPKFLVTPNKYGYSIQFLDSNPLTKYLPPKSGEIIVDAPAPSS